MHTQLNPLLETLFLLAAGNWDADKKAETIALLDTLGVAGAEFYQQHYSVVERYYRAFAAARTNNTPLFCCGDTILRDIYAYLFWHHPEWAEENAAIPEDAAGALIRSALADAVDTGADIIDALDTLGLCAETKWNILVLLQKPSTQIARTAAAIRENLPAYEKARKAVAAELSILLADAAAYYLDGFPQSPIFEQTRPANARPVPTLALPVAVMVLDTGIISGLLNEKIERTRMGDVVFSRENLLLGAKALSDKSKLDILFVLKHAPMYNLEIARAVGLTAATVSHHMGMLMSSGFVELEKQEGKVYYRLREKEIQRFADGLLALLL